MQRPVLTQYSIDIYKFIDGYLAEREYPPTRNEIAESLGLSETDVRIYMRELEYWHYLSYPRGSRRAIELTDKKL